MRRLTAVLSAAAVVVATSVLFAQAKPNFAGKWVLEPAAGADGGQMMAGGGQGGGRMGGRMGRGMRGGWGQNVTITQDANTLTVDYSLGQNPVKAVYKLDGSESHNTMTGRGGQSMDQVSKAAWDGNTIVITTTTQFGEQKRTLSMEGDNLVLTTSTQNGDVKATYKKGM
jgi:hypothetical protein